MEPPYQILIVDDEPDVCAALERSIKSDKFKVTMSSGPEEALQLLKDQEFHAVIADHNMPNMIGLELLGKIQVEWPAIARFLITAQRDINVAVAALNSGAVHRLLLKPWDHTDIRQALRETFEALKSGHPL